MATCALYQELRLVRDVSGSAGAGSWDGPSVGSSEPLQVSKSYGRSSDWAKTSWKSLGVVISIHSMW